MERVLSQLIGFLANRDRFEVHVVLYGKTREVVYPLPGNVVVHRPKFVFSDERRTWHTLKTICFLRNIVKSLAPDRIMSFGEYWNNLVLLSLFGLPYPVFVSDRSRPDKNLGRLQNALRNRLYPTAAGFIAQTRQAQAVALRRRWNDNIRVIGNPIRMITDDPAVAREDIVLSVGRLIRTKHYDRLIRLFAGLDVPGWKLVIVGGDAQRQNQMAELRALVDMLGVTNRVSLEGNQADVDAYYRRARIFAFTSSSEGFPNVVGEALSAGLPVISYDCVAGPAEMIVDGENGFLVPVFEDDLFARKLRLLMEDTGLRERMATKARPRVERFSVEAIGEQFLEFMLKQ